jgi:nucleotide-binding universal stress UspA family protein
MEIKLILSPIDFSEFSIRAYRYALSLAEHYRAKLVAQHVVELSRHPSLGFVASGGLYDEFRKALHESAEQELRNFVKQHTHGQFTRSSWCNREQPQTIFCRLRKRRKAM